ncbi:hypothetical protein [Flavobacterium sp.]|jgi:RAB protein geranylgeranyltransferase component A|uniref:hypothetical protein n=1 Tax=Flavobacterium sp. TaxID=239 RepID=UPI0035B022CE
MSNPFTQEILSFFENIEKYYGSKTEISECICTDIENFEPEKASWNLFEFELFRSAYRKTGEKFILEGKGFYIEIAAEKIIDFKKNGRNKFEFIEKYSESVFRITKIRFHYKY